MTEKQYKKYEKKTEYYTEKQKKMDNFTFLNKNYCKKNQNVIFGDSITELFNMELFDEYTEKTGVKVYNRGISGDTSNRLFERLEDNVISISPENIVILIGINDLTSGADSRLLCSNIRKILVRLKEQLPDSNVIVEAIYPLNTKKSNNLKLKSVQKKLAGINCDIKQTVNEFGARFLDLTDELSDSDGHFCAELTYDGLHPNVHGFVIAARHIIDIWLQNE